MILPDVTLLVDAHNEAASLHARPEGGGSS